MKEQESNADLLFDPLWDSLFLLSFFEDPPTNGLAAVEAARETTAKLAAASFLFSAARHHAHLCENLCPPSGKKTKNCWMVLAAQAQKIIVQKR